MVSDLVICFPSDKCSWEKNECNRNQNYITILPILLLHSAFEFSWKQDILRRVLFLAWDSSIVSLGHINLRIKPAHIKIVITLVAFSYIEPFLMKHLFLVFAVFEPFKDPRVDTIAPKLLFIALNLAAMGLGVWKVSSTNMVC